MQVASNFHAQSTTLTNALSPIAWRPLPNPLRPAVTILVSPRRSTKPQATPTRECVRRVRHRLKLYPQQGERWQGLQRVNLGNFCPEIQRRKQVSARRCRRTPPSPQAFRLHGCHFAQNLFVRMPGQSPHLAAASAESSPARRELVIAARLLRSRAITPSVAAYSRHANRTPRIVAQRWVAERIVGTSAQDTPSSSETREPCRLIRYTRCVTLKEFQLPHLTKWEGRP